MNEIIKGKKKRERKEEETDEREKEQGKKEIRTNRKGTESIRTQVNSYLSQFVLILVNSYSVFGQFVLIL